MKIGLIAPITRRREPAKNYPMGLASIASSLIQGGHEVEVLDLDITRPSPMEIEQRIKAFHCDAIGIGGLISTYQESKGLTQMIKRYHPDTKVVIGGRMAASSPEMWLEKTPADIVVEGEGEVTGVELFNALENQDDLIDVKGIWFKDGDKLIRTLPRPYIPDLDQLPMPAFDLFDIEAYMDNYSKHVRNARTMMMISCRGCVVLCSFCYQGFGGFRQRSVGHFMREVEYLVDRYGMDTISICDSTFMVNKKFVEEFSHELIKRKLNLNWYCASRVSDLKPKHKDLIKLMKEAGCKRMHFGVESGSPTVLKEIKKGTTVEAAEQSIRMVREVGIPVHATFIYGLPGETKETLQETVEFCRRNLTPTTFFYATAYPETELYTKALGEGKIKDEEAFISTLGDVDTYTVNLSDIPDEDFISLKEQAEEQTRLPIHHFLYRYWREYGTVRLLGYFQFIWESYPTWEIASRVLGYLRPKKVKDRGTGQQIAQSAPESKVKDMFPIS